MSAGRIDYAKEMAHIQSHLQLPSTITEARSLARLRNEVSEGSISAKKAFFTFLNEHAVLYLQYDRTKASENEKNKHKMAENILGTLRVPYYNFLLFSFIYQHAQLLSSKEKELIDEIVNQFYQNDSMTVDSAMWQMAQVIFNRLSDKSKWFDFQDTLRSQLLIAYIKAVFDKTLILQRMETLKESCAPLSLNDYIFYKMAEAAPAALLGESKEVQPGVFPNDKSFGDQLINVMAKPKPWQRLEGMDLNHFDNKGDDNNENLKFHEMNFIAAASGWIGHLNTHYQQLTTPAEQQQLKEFVEGVNQFHRRVVAVANGKQDVKLSEEQTRPLEEEAEFLIQEATRLFHVSKPRAPVHLAIGIGLMVIGACLLAIGLSAVLLLCPPVAGFFAATALLGSASTGIAVTGTQLAIATTVIGSSSIVGGAVAGLFGVFGSTSQRREALIETQSKRVINICEFARLDTSTEVPTTAPVPIAQPS